MALPAGRVGVAKDQVDEFGNIIGGSAPDNVYTKTQCDNKFETKTHASNTYQPVNIEVPLELLGGSQLTVETSLHALEDTLGTLRFRNSDGTPQVKTPSGDWVNFNSGGSDGIPEFDLSSFSPEVSARADALYVIMDAIKINIYGDSSKANLLAEGVTPTGCILVKNIPVDTLMYYNFYDSNGNVHNMTTNAFIQDMSFVGGSTNSFKVNANKTFGFIATQLS